MPTRIPAGAPVRERRHPPRHRLAGTGLPLLTGRPFPGARHGDRVRDMTDSEHALYACSPTTSRYFGPTTAGRGDQSAFPRQGRSGPADLPVHVSVGARPGVLVVHLSPRPDAVHCAVREQVAGEHALRARSAGICSGIRGATAMAPRPAERWPGGHLSKAWNRSSPSCGQPTRASCDGTPDWDGVDRRDGAIPSPAAAGVPPASGGSRRLGAVKEHALGVRADSSYRELEPRLRQALVVGRPIAGS
jgi:hypothetical protein